ncbi:hypothetical protein LEP1GSC193_2672 [Leptospira alstonii serovar Pingchang str. 80-412]|uniref:Uncharacterized protein n=2 Tax=Leptospira alstonii TaxID=28452 RepID=M6CUG4_9LEPT|nr:hypothetical protein LEP1GSC194_0189 [Leptospira alstonii serovar Sichuan str. 79601]EQA79271.1 hypothetical protein LEP1GSC193_2672 [Leptospira alstonii serovar Pingchang str. 80-412]
MKEAEKTQGNFNFDFREPLKSCIFLKIYIIECFITAFCAYPNIETDAFSGSL